MIHLFISPNTFDRLKAGFVNDSDWLKNHKGWKILSSSNGVKGLNLGKEHSDVCVLFVENGNGRRKIVSFDYVTGKSVDEHVIALLNFTAIYKGFLSGLSVNTLNRMITTANRSANIDLFVEYAEGPDFKGF